jgi:hypothetical protein
MLDAPQLLQLRPLLGVFLSRPPLDLVFPVLERDGIVEQTDPASLALFL